MYYRFNIYLLLYQYISQQLTWNHIPLAYKGYKTWPNKQCNSIVTLFNLAGVYIAGVYSRASSGFVLCDGLDIDLPSIFTVTNEFIINYDKLTPLQGPLTANDSLFLERNLWPLYANYSWHNSSDQS